MRKYILLGIQALGTLGLVALVVWKMDWANFSALFPRIDWPWVWAAFALTLPMLLMAGIRWHGLLNGWGVSMSLPLTCRWVFIAHFFTNLMPGMVGHDAAYLYGSIRASGRPGLSLAILLYDRIAGFAGLFLVGLWGFFWVDALRGNLFFALLLGASGFMLAASVIVFNLPIFTRLLLWVSQRAPGRLKEVPERFAGHLRLSGDRGGRLLRAVLWGFFMQLLNAVAYYLCARSLGVPFGMAESALFLCLLSLVVLIPISINGIGLREATSVQFFHLLGLPAEEAVAVSLIFFLQQLAWGLLGSLALIGSHTSTRDLREGVAAE